MPRCPIVALLLSLLLPGQPARADPALDCDPLFYSVSPLDDQLRRLSLADASTLSSRTITLPGQTVSGATALTVNPLTGELWALIKAGSMFRELAIVDADTGVATSVGTTDVSGLAGLAFDGAGALYGVSGDGGTPPETLFTLSTVDATSTLVLTLGGGDDGETIGFNPDDGLLYHASGLEGDCQGPSPAQTAGVCFESIDPLSLTIDGIDISGTDLTLDEGRALVYRPSAAHFLWAQGFSPNKMYTVTTAGLVADLGPLDHPVHGLALFRPRQPEIFLTNDSLDWCPTGGGLSYDIVRGRLGALLASGGDFAIATQECLIDNHESTSFPYTIDPDPGQAFWFLVRSVLAGGQGSYDAAGPAQVAPRDAGIAAGPDCP